MTFGRPSLEDRAQARQQERERNLRVLAQTRGRAATYAGSTAEADPKTETVECEAYRRLVASLPCIHCCIVGFSQAAHPNTGKGMGTKTDDRECFPLCADTPGRRGCHTKFDQGALFSKDRRRELESLWGQQTRAVIEGMGLCPQINIPKE